MKVIPENQFKRGDAVIHSKRFSIKYIFLDNEEKKTKTEFLTVYTATYCKKTYVNDWFNKEYPLYEILLITEED